MARKLWFAGIFQSAIPQFAQLILIILLFYFFISGWQAQKLYDALLDLTSNNNYPTTEASFFPNDSVKMGVLFNNNTDGSNPNYFIFWQDSAEFGEEYKFINIDSTLSEELWGNTQNIFGNGILAYPYNLHPWQKSIDNLDFWQMERPVKIYPFPFVSANDGWLLKYFFNEEDHNDEGSNVLFDVDNNGINFGRLSLPIYNEQGILISHFAFDIMLNS